MIALEGLRVVVTGGTGFLGSSLCTRLLSDGASVTVLARREAGHALARPGDRYEFVACDLTDADRTAQAIRAAAPQVLIHFASHPDGPEDRKQAAASITGNILTTVNALEAFREVGGELFVYGDSSKVYGDGEVPYREAARPRPRSSYAIAKAAGWQFCELYQRLHGTAVVSVRPTLIYGPGQGRNLVRSVIDAVLDGKPEVELMGGMQTRDPLFVDDAIDAFVAVLRRGKQLAGRVINIGGGYEFRVVELAIRIAEQMHADVRVVCLPSRIRPTDTARSFSDNTEARELLQWVPRTGLDEGLARCIAHSLSARGLPLPSETVEARPAERQ